MANTISSGYLQYIFIDIPGIIPLVLYEYVSDFI